MEHIFAVQCMPYVPNPYDLVLTAAARARELHRGAAPRITPDSRSGATIALSEIAGGAFSPDELIELRLPRRVLADEDRPEQIGPPDEQALLEGMAASVAFELPRDEAIEPLN